MFCFARLRPVKSLAIPRKIKVAVYPGEVLRTSNYRYGMLRLSLAVQLAFSRSLSVVFALGPCVQGGCMEQTAKPNPVRLLLEKISTDGNPGAARGFFPFSRATKTLGRIHASGMGNDHLKRYGLAAFAVLFALVTRLTLMPLLGNIRYPFIAFIAAIVFCAWSCGLWPSVFAMVLSIFCAWFAFLSPHAFFRLQQPGLRLEGPSAIVAFGALSLFIIAFGESTRRARINLENGVRERTEALSAANEGLRSLTAQLLELQDAERRRLARELHDSVGQILAAISMNMQALKKMELPAAAEATLKDNAELVREGSRQIRTISHLLHPPLLDEIGLLAAVKWYVDGFSERSGVAIQLKAPEHLPRLDQSVETTTYRMIQECLTNIHRHSGSSSGSIEIARTSEGLTVVVADKGKGIPAEKLRNAHRASGVGLKGLTERIRQLGGTLSIYSDRRGTIITAKLPADFAGARTEARAASV
jgi:signal transduction histidine kinase